MVNSSEYITTEFIGHASVPRNRIDQHFDLINAKRTSYEALHLCVCICGEGTSSFSPAFPKNAVESLIKASFVCGKRALEFNRTAM